MEGCVYGVHFLMLPQFVQPCLRTSLILKPLPHGMICKHSWALDLLHYAGSFYEVHRFLNTPRAHTRGKEPSLEFILIIIRQNPSVAPTLTDLHKGQRNFLPRLSVRRIWLIVPLLICEFDESFNISRFFFFLAEATIGSICIPVWLGHPLCSWCFEHAPRCANSRVVVDLRNLVN